MSTETKTEVTPDHPAAPESTPEPVSGHNTGGLFPPAANVPAKDTGGQQPGEIPAPIVAMVHAGENPLPAPMFTEMVQRLQQRGK
jgi:hypothetical protein